MTLLLITIPLMLVALAVAVLPLLATIKADTVDLKKLPSAVGGEPTTIPATAARAA